MNYSYGIDFLLPVNTGYRAPVVNSPLVFANSLFLMNMNAVRPSWRDAAAGPFRHAENT